jgi:hypothetical protein
VVSIGVSRRLKNSKLTGRSQGGADHA